MEAYIYMLAKYPVTKEQISVIAPTPKEVIWNACK